MSVLPERFQSDRLVMRPFEMGDASWVFLYASDPEVTRYMDWPAHKSIDDSVAFIQMNDEGRSSGDQYAWAVTTRTDERPIGSIGCSELTHKVSFGYVLSRDAWGKGYATEASRALLACLEQVANLERIWAVCDVDNLGSARVLRKLGLNEEGILKRWKIRPNLPGKPARDSFMFAKIIGR